jgi:hypothetical protein
MPIPGPHPRIIHDSQHASTMARDAAQITQPRRSSNSPLL